MSNIRSDSALADTEINKAVSGDSLLSRDDIPDENQRKLCFSCVTALTGLYCHNCGQKNDDYRRSIWSLFIETFTSIFSLENRMWRTCFKLITKPGYVSREFSDGKRTSWTSPVRIYLALSILLFGYMGLTETHIFSIRTDIVAKSDKNLDVQTLPDTDIKLVPEFGFFKRQSELDRENAKTDFDRVSRLMMGTERQAFDFEGDLSIFGQAPSNKLLKSSGSWPINSEDQSMEASRNQALVTYKNKFDDLIDQYNDILSATQTPHTIIDRLFEADQKGTELDLSNELPLGDDSNTGLQEKLLILEKEFNNLGIGRDKIHELPVKMKTDLGVSLGEGNIFGLTVSETDTQKLVMTILRNPVLLNEGISTYLPRIMFLMMPFAAILGLVFIRGKKTALLYDHLVHATYIHAVTFAFLLLLILLSQLTPLTGMYKVFLIGVAVYLPLSAKNMFKRSWLKTIFASYSIAFLYSMAMFLIIVTLTAISVVNAATSALA
jgi:hypothetical protein